MGAPRLVTPKLTVVMDDGAEFVVQSLNVDMLKWDRTRAAKKWPTPDEAPFVAMTFLAWHALRREQQIPEMSLEDFEGKCLSVRSDEATAVDPTRPEAEPD